MKTKMKDFPPTASAEEVAVVAPETLQQISAAFDQSLQLPEEVHFLGPLLVMQ